MLLADIGRKLARCWLWPALALLLITYIAHFLHAEQFGFYEDDWFIIVPAIGSEPVTLENILWALQHPQYFSGRPLGFRIVRWLLSFNFDGTTFHHLYLIASVIVSINGVLMFLLLRRGLPESLAFLGAVLFLLYPADTTRQFLVHSYFIQTSMMFALLHIFLFQTRLKWLSLLLLPLPLLIYESAYFLCLAAPLITSLENRRHWLRVVAIYTVFWALLLIWNIDYRSADTDLRIDQVVTNLSSIGQAFATFSGAWLQADLTALKSYPSALLNMLSIDAASYWLSGLALAAISMLVVFLLPDKHSVVGEADQGGAVKLAQWTGVGGLLFIIGGVSAGLISLTTHAQDVSVLAGRITRFYLVSGVGLALFIIATYGYLIERWKRFALLRHAPLAMMVVLVFGYGAYAAKVQSDYAAAWQTTQSLIQQSVALNKLWLPGSRIIVEGDWQYQSDYDGGASSIDPYIGLPYALENIFDFKDLRGDDIPRLFLADTHWREHLVSRSDDGCWVWQQRVLRQDWRGDNPICADRLTVLRAVRGVLERTDGKFTDAAAGQTLLEGKLFDFVLGGTSDDSFSM